MRLNIEGGEHAERADACRAVALSLLAGFQLAALAAEPKQGGILRIYHRDSPASASIHEEATYSVNIPFMAVFNNLVMYKQDVAQNSLESIVPDLAESWAWSGDGKTLNFKLQARRQVARRQAVHRPPTSNAPSTC